MNDTRDSSRLTSMLYRLAPRSLRGRLIVTTLVIAMIVVASTFTIATALNARAARLRTEATIGDSLRRLSDYLHLRAATVSSPLDELAARSDVAKALFYADQFTLGMNINNAYAGHRVQTVMSLSAAGRPLTMMGSRSKDTTSLAQLAIHARRRVSGVFVLPSGPAYVAIAPIPASGPRVGTVIAVRPLAKTDGATFTSSTGVSLRIRPAGSVARPSAWQATRVPGFADSRFNIAGSQVTIMSSVLGIDGKPALDVVMHTTDPGQLQAESLAWISILASSVFAGIIGLSVGVVVADLVREPVEEMVSRVKREGYRAIEGMPYSGVSLDTERLPREFRELGAVVDGLLYGLSARQAELKRVTVATQEAEEALAVTVDESYDTKILVQDGLIRIANPATESHLGIGPRALLGRTPEDAFTDIALRSEDGTPIGWSDLTASMSPEPRLVRAAIPGRGERWLEMRLTNPHSETQDRVLLTAHDITDSRRLEQLRAELISMVSHDLRSPLTVIVGYLDLLGTGLPEAAHDKAITSARANAARMESMLDDLLNATRAEELFAPKVLLRVAVCPLMEDVAQSMTAASPDHAISMVCDAEPTVMGEERRLRQALVNLVGNAIKYSPRESTISMRVSVEGQWARIAVEDQGPGIPDEYKRTVFDRFTRVSGASGAKPGMGLGLFIVRVIIEGHGGRVFVEDVPGGGSRFVVEVPVAQDA